MPSSHFPYTVLILLLTSSSSARCQVADFIQDIFCWNQDFRLDCNWNSVLAFHEAYFTNDEAQLNRSMCADIKDGRESCTEDLRTSINKRCSGMSHCHYNLTEDHPDRECRCKGVIVLRYSCVPEKKIDKFCNIKITGTSGYISSPGYPRFYPKVSNCTWNLESSIKQEMKITVLDMDLRPGIQTRGKEICPDSLVILENNHKVLYTCGQADDKTRIPVLTTGGHVQITFKSNEFLPSRGFLLYYKFNGCQKLPPPRLGYLVYSNNRSAMYMCCKGHVFNDTLSNSLLLQCVDGTYWNGTVTQCLTVKEALRYRNNNTDDLDGIHEADVVEVYLRKYKYIEEILIPAACVVGLVFGNVAIILLIQKIRKKRKASSSHHNGRSTSVPPSVSSTQVPQTLHVPTTIPTEPTVPNVQKHTIVTPTAPKPPMPPPLPVVRQAPRVLMTDL
ncbi:mannan-binding lectin serine protease 1-like isoform X1 [Argiope bruennichi]|uniref:Mannan-binding lectin serine protease 1 like protein n=1 Tax=Argiope bruennichi TaxID=94029 RepID=A0A8T0E5E5_ARGBR|nr:mannan-binding lectin serine protease 1-like isoform X1 [Argiope bruennichi]KAF8764454.1 Mannan-binding lectin serine protease 1 like protein [Argiope bruennichi]